MGMWWVVDLVVTCSQSICLVKSANILKQIDMVYTCKYVHVHNEDALVDDKVMIVRTWEEE